MNKHKDNAVPFIVKKTISGIKPFVIMLFIALLLAWVPIVFASIAVLDFELNDLTLQENLRDSQYSKNAPNAPELARTATLAPLLRSTLSSQYHLIVKPVPSSLHAEADQGFGYLFSHPQAAAQLGKTVDAEWVVVSRLHKPSFLFAYLITHVVHVPTGKQLPEIIVEIKGQQQTLNQRGINALAKKIFNVVQQR
ncbi:DUF3280 domain-containing protein [Enterovibrio sp. ZSDZ42]|uniref:DUF3280 domain-containing protein n=1 Tax=Enterovibrio gelatinilyticus TaxID=2899819 RepID=A0ABT5R0P4_9GAMM|nr:DUF2380 domain-containing protein [Enterovibrio sp. ZSDZ42]MDD1793836.1 DUF3280 domain-containing protein [Enterovibrio sp. ZSDZ42]